MARVNATVAAGAPADFGGPGRGPARWPGLSRGAGDGRRGAEVCATDPTSLQTVAQNSVGRRKSKQDNELRRKRVTSQSLWVGSVSWPGAQGYYGGGGGS